MMESMLGSSVRTGRRPGRRSGAALAAWVAGVAAILAPLPASTAQPDESPVYVEDSPAAAEAIDRAREFARAGNAQEAARVLQALLDRQGALLVPRAVDGDVFVEARTRVHEVLLERPDLLEAYMEMESGAAAAMLRTGEHALAERTRLLTGPGFDATLRLAQEQLESARFGSAWVTLMQLDRHPSRTGDRAHAAASLAELVVRYLDSGEAPRRDRALEWGIVARWHREAGLEPPADRTPAEGPELDRAATPYDRLGPLDLSGILEKPLASALMGETQPEWVQRLASEVRGGSLDETGRVLHAAPTVAGDVLYVNDSETVTAFDRFTLTRLWRTSLIGPPATATQTRGPAGIEDTSGVAIAEPYAVALTGPSLQTRNARERILGAFDMQTGEVAWATSLSALADPALQESLLRGPVETHEGSVLLTTVRSVNRQRLLSVGVIAFDAETGDVRWVRQIGSIGVLPHVPRPEATELPLVRDGMLYRTDRIGVVAAMEVDTGRIRWVRRMERDFGDRTRAPSAWSGSRPILLDDGRLVTLDPDRRRVSVLDASTGALLDSVSAVRFGQPEYLLRLGDHIVGVEERQVTARHIGWLTEERAPLALTEFVRGGIRGRVVVAGDELLVPHVEGVRIVRLRPDGSGGVEPVTREIELDEPGQVVAAPGQIVAVDDFRVHSYLSWEVADELLRSRMRASPRDASPAITYADLAFRAGHPDRILEAVDRAVRTIERDPLSDDSERSRERLFATMLEMIEPPAHARHGAPLSDGLREALIDRLSRVASPPAERVSALMAAGRLYETTGRPERAVERYQEVLSAPVLAGTVYQEGGRRLPAEAEATRRLRRLIRLEGREVYGAYEAEAARLLREAERDGEPERFERIARRYPVSSVAPTAWLAAAERYGARGASQKEILSLEEGVAAAQETLSADDPTFGELAGRLVTALLASDRLVLAEQRLAWFRSAHPSLMLRVDAEPIDAGALGERIGARLGERARRPRIGPELGETRALQGWAIARPLDASSGARLTDRLLMEGLEGQRAMFALGEGGDLELRWTIPGEDGDLLRVDHRSVFFASIASGNTPRTVTRYETETGALAWETPGFGSLFDAGDPFENIAGRNPVANTPLQPEAPLADIFAVFNAETMVLVERTGRAAAFDVESGELLWAHDRGPAPIQPVHDVVAGNGFVAVAGRRLLPAGARAGDGGQDLAYEGVVAVREIRTGKLLYEHVDRDTVRWLRVTPEGHLLVGMDRSMASFDVFRQRVRWRSDRGPLADTVGAWVFPGVALHRDATDALRLIDTEDGSSEDTVLRVEGRIEPGMSHLEVTRVGDRLLLATYRGAVLIDEAGTLLGVDARRTDADVLPAAAGERFVVLIDEEGVPAGDLGAYDLSIFDLRSLKLAAPPVALELGARPTDVALLDGKILVSAGMVTLVIDAPPSR